MGVAAETVRVEGEGERKEEADEEDEEEGKAVERL